MTNMVITHDKNFMKAMVEPRNGKYHYNHPTARKRETNVPCQVFHTQKYPRAG